jgi:hypothetical protein
VIISNVTTMSAVSELSTTTSMNENPLICLIIPEKKYTSLSLKDACLFLMSHVKYHEQCQKEEKQ